MTLHIHWWRGSDTHSDITHTLAEGVWSDTKDIMGTYSGLKGSGGTHITLTLGGGGLGQHMYTLGGGVRGNTHYTYFGWRGSRATHHTYFERRGSGAKHIVTLHIRWVGGGGQFG